MADIDPINCCPGEANQTIVTRVIMGDLATKTRHDYFRGHLASGKELVTYKALSRINGNSRNRKVSTGQTIETKANAGRQLGSTLLSSIIPGDTGPIRSPIRSAFYRTITPGFGRGGRGGSRPGENRGYRCPEGYQFGGRFTDNRLSTCGMKLFDIPSPLGAAIRAIRNATRNLATPTTAGRTITGEQVDSTIIQSRKPQIPKVGVLNAGAGNQQIRNAIQQIGDFNKGSNLKVRRMIRRDGFVLEPVVPNKVLRAIPDNRDMEGAAFLTSALSPKDIGGEELGLLSNTGIQSLVYVLPGGSTLRLEKKRKLTVGERRKLGRTVNSVQSISNQKDPAARLRAVADELGGGLLYSENFDGIKNPNQVINGTMNWVNKLFKNRKLSAEKINTEIPRKTVSYKERGKLITNLDNAINHIADGGSFADISPDILPKVFANANLVQKQRISNKISLVSSGQQKYFLYESPNDFQHLAERFASDVQQHLGLESPDVLFVGKSGNKRKYLRQDVESAIQGGKFNPNAKFETLEPNDVAAMMISDFLTDQRSRPAATIYPIDTADGTRAVLAENTTSGLIDLSKIEITKRMKMKISDFYDTQLVPSYSDYYQALRAEQRVLFIKYISQMINKAKSFNPKKFASDMNGYGLSDGEKIHLNIISKLFAGRLEVLMNQKDELRQIIIK